MFYTTLFYIALKGVGMFVQASPSIRIFCDDQSRALRVQVNIFASLPQYKAQWGEVAQFTDPSAWYTSPYARQIEKESLRDDIDWFWHDIS